MVASHAWWPTRCCPLSCGCVFALAYRLCHAQASPCVCGADKVLPSQLLVHMQLLFACYTLRRAPRCPCFRLSWHIPSAPVTCTTALKECAS